MNRIQTIVEKEWAEVFKNRIVLFTVAFLPILFTALPLIILYTTRGAASAGDSADLPPSFAKACGSITSGECMQIFLVNQFMILFMMMPLIIPVAIASYSIVGEKATRSLEPLLATPITTPELLAGKSLAAAVPAILATWVGFVVFVIGVPFVGGGPALITSILGSVWLTAIFVVGPLMAVMAVNFAIMVSSRVNDPRAAEQISAVVVVPILGLMFGQIAGVIVLNVQLMMLTALALAIIDVGLIYLGARLFQRETILTKWK
ncbi:MAG: ABC transporter permease subunit [Chloroflexi bacterium]|nr:ABC transporter permease subunit [Chloroflexota bacterium]